MLQRDEDIHRLREDLDKKNFKISVIRQETVRGYCCPFVFE